MVSFGELIDFFDGGDGLWPLNFDCRGAEGKPANVDFCPVKPLNDPSLGGKIISPLVRLVKISHLTLVNPPHIRFGKCSIAATLPSLLLS